MSNLKIQVTDYITRLQEAIPDIQEELEKASIEMSFYDKALSEAYHNIENVSFLSSFKYFVQLRDILKKRREVKYRHGVLSMIKDTVFKLPEKLHNHEVRYFRDNPNYKEDFSSCID